MLNKILAATPAIALSVFSSIPGLALPAEIPMPTEVQFLRYEMDLASFFMSESTILNTGAYARKTKRERRRDGYIACVLLQEYAVVDHFYFVFSAIYKNHQGDDKRLAEEVAYALGVTTSAVDNICIQHRAELMDWFAKYKASRGQK
ncbi:hypothetical protein [Sphaerospermopsis sp. LEGE 08334]|jgi:hypothetical protein|uniref:hypothetical protein n=1 Tax=Sphaerospermopsis sp. LEGE 08334 TaxID=1828651 RepID=UPI0018801C9B|nr:hypothetical protein [Sphaerospermopsis sp. LEGE 08334]MBE9056606.1 hypothetical protein [Sphaerospermopsis sp. LEGE 08334]